jgi:hypothetical protein
VLDHPFQPTPRQDYDGSLPQWSVPGTTRLAPLPARSLDDDREGGGRLGASTVQTVHGRRARDLTAWTA